MSDEVPFNGSPDGSSVVMKGGDAAVRSIVGCAKRAGTAILSVAGDGELLPIILIFKRNSPWAKKEDTAYKKLRNVIVVYSSSSYINDALWTKELIGKVLVPFWECEFGNDFRNGRQKCIHISDNHASHFTSDSLKYYDKRNIFPAFTPANYTTHFMPIDDRITQVTRGYFYECALDYEEEYYDENPDGDGKLSAGDRRMLQAQW
jgi:hypothetical protein